MKNAKRKKICFISSSGGHFAQLAILKPLCMKFDCFYITEHTKYKVDLETDKLYFLHQANRKRLDMPFWMIVNSFISLKVLIKENPDIVISTGVLATIPMCLLAKLFGKKLIYIESFANIVHPSKTGKFLYKFADRFYIQWEQLKEFFPNAIYLGGIY